MISPDTTQEYVIKKQDGTGLTLRADKLLFAEEQFVFATGDNITFAIHRSDVLQIARSHTIPKKLTSDEVDAMMDELSSAHD